MLNEKEFQEIKNGKKCFAGPVDTNLKCIVISLFLAAGYWYLPKKNKWVLLGILYFIYLAIAWYDHWYDCRRNALGPTYLKFFYSWAKPKDSYQNILYANTCKKLNNKILFIDMLVLFCGIILLPSFLKWRPK